MELRIDPELEAYLPPLGDEESERLEERILAEGIRDPLVVWRTENTIVDGHNRYRIAQQHGLEFGVTYLDFDDKEHVKDWIDANALARRNLTPDWFRYLIGRRYERSKKAQGAPTGNDNRAVQRDQNDTFEKTADRIAKEHGVSSPTVKRAAKFAQEVDADPELKQALFERKPVSKVKKQKQIETAKQTVTVETAKSVQADAIAYHEKASDFASRFADQSVDLLLTDPPYSTDLSDVEAFAQAWLPTFLRKVKATGRAYIFIGAYPQEMRAYLNVETPEHIGLSQILVWTYRNTLGQTPKDRYKLNWQAVLYFAGEQAGGLDSPITAEQWAVQDIVAPDGRQGDRFHEWQKPLEIAERFVRHSTKNGDIVIDPFTCTGTFLLAASKLGRNAYGADVSIDNLKIAEDRGCTIIGETT